MVDHYEATVILPDFSNSVNSITIEPFVIGTTNLYLPQDCTFKIYANGNCKENKGYVSIICNEKFMVSWADISNGGEVRFSFSVVDVFRNKRFTQYLVIIPSKTELPDTTKDSSSNSHFWLERYLRRETLLNDPAELLPGDCLTILVEMYYIPCLSRQSFPHHLKNDDDLEDKLNFGFLQKFVKYDSLHKFEFKVDESGGMYILLDTFYGRELCNLSGFFQIASSTTLNESTTRRVHIPDEELNYFSIICNILFTPTLELELDSIKDICQLYVIADKYDFQSVIGVCRALIKAFLCTTDDTKIQEHAAQSVPDIIKFSEEYKDIDLKDSVKTYLESKEIFGMNEYALGKSLKEKLFSDWKCVSTNDSLCLFKLSRNPRPEFYL